MIAGLMEGDGIAHFRAAAARATDPILRQVFDASVKYGNLREVPPSDFAFTDDKAPIEEVIDQIILGVVNSQ
jgi:hypothetical protein